MHWENTHVLAIVEAMLIFWELTCALSVVHWITRGTREISGNVVHCQALCIIIWPLLNKRTCVTFQTLGDMLARSVTHSKHGSHDGPLSDLYPSRDMYGLSTIWRHAGKEHDTLQTWQPWWSTIWPLPIKRTCMPFQTLGDMLARSMTWHSPNMAVMVVHCLTTTHQETCMVYQPSGNMLARSVTHSKHGSHGGPLFDLYPSRGQACPINHLETCWQGAWHSPSMAAMVVHCLTSTHQEDMHALSTIWRHAGKEGDTLQTWQPWWSTVWPLPIKRHVWSIDHLETCWQGAWHSPNMAAMVVHCLTTTHQETCMVYQPSGNMLARSVTHSKHGSHGGPLFDLYPSRGQACPINHLETCWQGAWHSPSMAAMVVHCLTSTHQEDMHALSTIWRHAGKEGDTLQTWQPWWSTVWPLPIKRHVWSIDHLETCWQGAWHSPNMAAMVVHCVTFTHQEDMCALSTIWRYAGKERDTLQTWQPWWSTVWPLPIKRTCMPYQSPGDMLARSVTLSKHGSHGGALSDLYPSRGHACPINHLETCWQGGWHTPNMAAMVVHCLTFTHQETCMVYRPSGDMLARSVTLSKHGSHGGPLCDLYPSRGHVCPINHLEICWQGAWHSANMAAMVVHCVTFTHQEDMHALSITWRHGGKERDTLQTWQPWWSTVWPLPIKRTCMPYQPPGDMLASTVGWAM